MTCGYGWKYRHIECRLPNNATSLKCKREEKPEYYEQCYAGDCPKWEFGAWSGCSARCGEGYMRRLVVCRNNEGNILDEASCEPSDKPDAIQNCRGETCGKWYPGEWSLVSSF